MPELETITAGPGSQISALRCAAEVTGWIDSLKKTAPCSWRARGSVSGWRL
jgi:hypothetical protein